jgi:ATP-dependent DNA helicase DinG
METKAAVRSEGLPDSSPASAVDAILGPGGLVARVIGPAYEARTPQLAMAHQVAQAATSGVPLVVEAGTGTGKSLAYLAGGVAAGTRLIVSTSSKALQGQLVHQDLPLLRRALVQAGRSLSFAVAKGKGNYLCLLKVQRLGGWAWPAGFDPAAMTDWANATESGDLDSVTVPLPWEQVDEIAADDACLGRNCSLYADCWYQEARMCWQDADVVIANHALLMVDLQVPGLILPGLGEPDSSGGRPTLLVCDEAHQLAAYAINALSVELTFRSYERAEHLCPSVTNAGRAFMAALAPYAEMGADRAIPAGTEFQEGHALAELLTKRARSLWSSGQPHSGEEAKAYVAAQRLRALAEKTLRLAKPTEPGHVRHIACGQRAGTSSPHAALAAFLVADTRWDVSGFLAQLPARVTSVIYTSATLATRSGPDSLSYFRRSVGVKGMKVDEHLVGSPFRYEQQGLLYLLPRGSLPADVNHPSYLDAAAQQIVSLLDLLKGQALVLFTSYAALSRTRVLLTAAPALRDVSFLVQGEDLSRNAMLDIFRNRHGRNLVILGTRSFWEGVSLEGDQLKLVIIDRIPFPAPDPVQQARAEALAARGGNWFMDLALPEAVGTLRQGAGRLIRTADDRGVVALLDSRLTSKPWGKLVLGALPAFRRTSSLSEVQDFLLGGQHGNRDSPDAPLHREDASIGSDKDAHGVRWESRSSN